MPSGLKNRFRPNSRQSTPLLRNNTSPRAARATSHCFPRWIFFLPTKDVPSLASRLQRSDCNPASAWYGYDRPKHAQAEPHERSLRDSMKLEPFTPHSAALLACLLLAAAFASRAAAQSAARATGLWPVQRALHLRRNRRNENAGRTRSARALRLRLVTQSLGQTRHCQPNRSPRRRWTAARRLSPLPWPARRQTYLLGRRRPHPRNFNPAGSQHLALTRRLRRRRGHPPARRRRGRRTRSAPHRPRYTRTPNCAGSYTYH